MICDLVSLYPSLLVHYCPSSSLIHFRTDLRESFDLLLHYCYYLGIIVALLVWGFYFYISFTDLLRLLNAPTMWGWGGDPSMANKVRVFLFVRYYKNWEWEDQIEASWFYCFGLVMYASDWCLLAHRQSTPLGQVVLSCEDRACPGSLGWGCAFPAGNWASGGQFHELFQDMDRISR